MKTIKITALLLSFIFVLGSCQYQLVKKRRYKTKTRTQTEEIKSDIKVAESIYIPDNGSSPVAGLRRRDNANREITFYETGQKIDVNRGETVNVIYDGIDPELTYIIYESTFDGYTLELAYRDEELAIEFANLCHIFIVASPSLTTVLVPENLKYEQIIWTPRSDGTWEVRIGTTQRGCKSKALNQLQDLRTKDYEKSVPK